jgi:hypothetical protein
VRRCDSTSSNRRDSDLPIADWGIAATTMGISSQNEREHHRSLSYRRPRFAADNLGIMPGLRITAMAGSRLGCMHPTAPNAADGLRTSTFRGEGSGFFPASSPYRASA